MYITRWKAVLVGVVALAVIVPATAFAATSVFDDVPDDSVYVNDINWLAASEVTKGCNPPTNTRFCPSSNVTREQMAAFMHRLAVNQVVDAGSIGGLSADDLVDDAELAGAIAGLTARLDTLEAENAALKATLAGVSRTGDTLLFTGMNLQVVNGLDSTRTSNSVGNVIIGYNADNSPVEDRTGSHYLVLGDENSYTNYAGIIAGELNTASGNYASVLGGRSNTVTGNAATVSGGIGNTASANWSSVSGGDSNTASGAYATVSGGFGNTASGSYASVSGGSENHAKGEGASVTGGHINWSEGMYSVVTGGSGNQVVGDDDTVVGGDSVINIGWPGAIVVGEGFLDPAD